MWPHVCPAERGLSWTGTSEPCNWCGQTLQIKKEYVMCIDCDAGVAKAFVDILKAAAGEDGALVSDNPDKGDREILIDGTFDLQKIVSGLRNFSSQ